MTKKHSTKKALIASTLSLLLCVSMLVGTTYAWFTDSVSSGRNTIQSGNLDVELQYSVLDANGNWTDYAEVDENTEVFDYNLWEPGYTQVAKFKVVNNGSLALKYQLTADVYTETLGKTKDGADIKLSDYIKYGITEDLTVLNDRATAAAAATNGFASFTVKSAFLTAEAGQNEAEVGMVFTMPTSVGNEANHDGVHIPSIEFGINLMATQYTCEEDSFDDQYDVDADYVVEINTAEALADAFENGGVVRLTDDISATDAFTVPAGVEVELDMNGKTITAPAGALWAIQNEGTLTVTGNGVFKGSYTALYSNGDLTIENGTFTATDGFGVLIDNIYGTTASAAVINGGTFSGLGVYNPTDVTINGGTFNVGRDPDGATDHLSDEMTLFINPTFVGAPNTAKVVLNGGTFNGDVYVYDDGITETVFVNNGATITGDVLDNA